MNWELIFSALSIPIGFWLLIWGANKFVDGSAALANNLGIPPLVIGLIIVGFATSAPEIMISAIAAWQGNSGLAVGNALGSNITNVALILGLSVLFFRIRISSKVLKKEFPMLLLVMLLSSYLMWDLTLTRTDGAVLVCSLFVLIGWIVWQGLSNPDDKMRQEFDQEIPQNISTAKALLCLTLGLLTLLFSSKFLIWGSTNIAHTFNISDLIIGLSIVALGTSLPELATTIACIRKNEPDIAIGNIIGSNMFNLLGVLGIAAAIAPSTLDSHIISRDITTMFSSTLLMIVLSIVNNHKRASPHIIGGLLLTAHYFIYQGYLIYIALLAPSSL